MNLENDSYKIWQKTGSWPIEMVGDDVVLVTLVSDEGDDVVQVRMGDVWLSVQVRVACNSSEKRQER